MPEQMSRKNEIGFKRTVLARGANCPIRVYPKLTETVILSRVEGGRLELPQVKDLIRHFWTGGTFV
jgi:hypothetical protein